MSISTGGLSLVVAAGVCAALLGHGCAQAVEAGDSDSNDGVPSGSGDPSGSGGSTSSSSSASGDGGTQWKCDDDDDCGSDAKPQCHEPSGACVECLPSTDGCPSGEYCDPATYACLPGCESDADCGGGGGGGGAGSCSTVACDPTTHQCTGCCADADCPLESVCDAATSSCVAGCTPDHACNAGKDCCDDGQCHDVQADPANCGACGTVCSLPNATPGCAAAECVVSMCDAGWGDCNAMAADGCELPTVSDPANCGTCGNVCGANNATSSCSGGVCQIQCNAGYGDCDGVDANGCETELASSLDDCGSCGNQCGDFGGTASCNGGVCSVTCDDDWCNCDGATDNGCEDFCGTSSQCGACGVECDAPNATNGCDNAQCTYDCIGKWDDCDGAAANGCETDTWIDEQNCGGCGVSCPASESCSFGNCQ
jgi:hypothetical protein